MICVRLTSIYEVKSGHSPNRISHLLNCFRWKRKRFLMKKRLLLWIIALVAFSGSTLFAQDLTGTWQGTLSPGGGRDLRTVIKISKQGDNYQAVFYSIDQGGQGMN